MALDFPPSPINGTIYVGPDGAQWRWDTVKWVAVPGSGSPGSGTVQSVAAGIGITATPNPIINAGTISLKPATATVLGGIIAGSGTTIDGTGLLTVSSLTTVVGVSPGINVTNGNTIALTQATAAALGGVVVGSNISVASGTISLASINVTNALGYTPYNSTNPSGYAPGTVLSLASGSGISLTPTTITTTGTINNTGVLSINAVTGVLTLGAGLQTAGQALSVKPATSIALGGVMAGTGVAIDGAGVISVSASGGVPEAPTGSGVSYMRNNSAWVSGGTLTGQLLAATGSITAPGISFAGDTNTGIYRPVAGHVRIAGAASDVVNFAGTPKLTTFFGPTVLYADPDGTRPLEAVTLQYLDSQMTTIATSAVGYFQATTASQAAPPNDGSIKWNTTDLTVATALYISKKSGNNTDISYALSKFKVGWELRIQKKIDNSRYIWHTITGAVTDSGTYYTVPVALGAGAYLGMPFVNNEQVILTIDSSASAGSFLPLAGGVMVGMIGLPATTPTASQAVRKDYVDTAISGVSGAGISSVAQTFTGGIISVAGSPVVAPNGTLALTVAGQSGGVPYFTTNSTWASSAFLANNRIVLGGGPGSAPFTSANYTTDNSGGMTLGTANSIVGTLLLQSSVTNPGSLALAGITSGAVLVRNNNTAAATYNFNLPSTAGTAGQVLTSQAGGTNSMTWTTPGSGGLTSVGLSFTGGIVSVANSPLVANGTLAMTVAGSSGGVPFFNSATTWATSAALVQNGFVFGGGAGFAPGTSPYFNTDGTAGAQFGANASVAGSLTLYASSTVSGALSLQSTSANSTTIRNPGTVAAPYNFNLPITAGVSGQVLTSAGGGVSAMTWTTPAASGIPEAPTGSGTSYIRTDSAWTSGGTFTSPLQLPIGSSSAVALNFGTTNTGLYQNASGYLQFTIAGSSKLQLGPTFVNILQQAQAVNGSQGAPSYAFASEIQSGMYWASANNVRITVQSTDVVNFSGTGGRNTTFYGPILTQANPATALEVANKQYTDNRTIQTITVTNSSADTMPTGVYDLGVFWVATTVNSSVAHVTSGTGTYTLSLGAVGSLTAITGISGVTTTSTTDTTATASALNVASAGQHLWLTISGTAAPGFCVSVKATIN